MKILQAHNYYLHRGGEDIIAEQEAEILSKAGFEVDRIIFDNENLKSSNLIVNRHSYNLVKDRIRSFSPDIFHVHNLFYSATPQILKAAKEIGIPVVMTLHNYRLVCPNGLLLRNNKPCMNCVDKRFAVDAIKYKCFQNSVVHSSILSLSLYYYQLFKYWTKYVDKFIVLTPFAKKTILNSSIGIDHEKIIIKPNSVDDFKSNESSEKRSQYLIVGRVSKEKGIKIAVEAFNKLENKKLTIVGDGPEIHELETISNSNITFLGRQNKKEIMNILHRSKALIVPSLCYEALPTTILESFSAGVPVISSDNNNLRDIVKHGQLGLNFKTGSAISLINTIDKFEELNFDIISKNARMKFLNYYTHEKNIKNLSLIYNDLIS